jgi:FkbM family methyltransferase
MAIVNKVRHSVAGRMARHGIKWAYRLCERGQPIRCKIAPGLTVELLPEGELAQFLFFGPLFEQTELRLIAALLKPDMTFIDAGANVGLYSVLAARRVGSNGTVWAFEPSAATFDLLRRNLTLNQVNNVAAEQLALSDAEGEISLCTQSGFGDLYRYLDYEGKQSRGGECEIVPVITLDAFAAQRNLGAIDVLKIDTEGGEFRLLKGARQLLSASSNAVVMFENEEDWCERAGCRPEDSLNLLKDLGFHLYLWSKRRQAWSRYEDAQEASRSVWAARDADLLPKERSAVPA